MVVYTVRRRKVTEMKHGETTAHNNDGQGCARTTADQCGLMSTRLSSHGYYRLVNGIGNIAFTCPHHRFAGRGTSCMGVVRPIDVRYLEL